MTDNVQITDLGKKIELLLRSDRSDIRTSEALLRAMRIGKDYYSRIRSGTRVLPEDKFLQLCSLFRLSQRDWYCSLTEFGRRLGYSRREISLITNTPIPGFDFASRIQDEGTLSALFNIMAGYWETFYFSVSKTDRPVVSRNLCVVERVNEDLLIECAVVDTISLYKGWCFPIRNHLYFIMEKADLFNEIIVYVTNLPERQPPLLFGIILCLSGGVDEMHSFPCAAKVAFRFLGDEAGLRERHGLDRGEDVRRFLEEAIPRYVTPDDPQMDRETRNILQDISNILPPGTVPAALRMIK